MFFPHQKTDRKGILNAIANESISVEVRFPKPVSSVTLVLRGSIGSAAVVEAFDKGGKVVDTARRYKVPERTGPEKPIPSFELTVRAPAIASVRFSGAPPAELPPLAGVVERMGETKDHHALILRVDAPCPGIVAVVAPVMGGQVVLSFDFHLYGERAADTAARDEPAWQRWMGEWFPFGGFGGSVG